MRFRGRQYLEPLSHLSLLSVLLNLDPLRLFLELSLTHSTVVLESEWDVQSGEPLDLRVCLPRPPFKHRRVRGPPFRQDVDLQFFE